MNELNYKISCEQIIKDNGIYYNLILFVPGTTTYTNSELLLGTNHKDKDLYKEYLEYLLNKYNSIKESSKDKNPKVDEVLKEINNRLNSL